MKKILIVEDDDIMREMMVQALSQDGYSVVAALDGLQAKHTFEKGHFDLVITDMVMPKMDGIQTIRELKNIDNDIKIIAISGGDRSFDGTTYLEIVKKSGADKTFVKPFDRREFLAAVTMLLEKPA